MESGDGHTVSFALSPPSVLDLETREVRVRLDLFDEWHLQSSVKSVR